jgi:phenylacetate-CoA ligase
MADLLAIYHRLPYPLRSLAASLHGFRLQSSRYSSETERLVAEAHEREYWSAAQWRTWQSERLAYILDYAAKHVPYYRLQWQVRRRSGDRASWEILENWPVLSKDIVREHPAAFLDENTNKQDLIVEHTSGTTGKPLTLWWSRKASIQWYALFEARWRGWAGVSRYDRWGILGGQLVVPFTQEDPPFWVWNAGMHQLYFSSYHLKPDNIKAYLDSMHQHRLVYLYGYASSLYTLARIILDMGLSAPTIKSIISNAEPLYVHQRETIARAFGCPVFDTYGQSELVCAASQCLSGNLHLWQDAGILEILEDKHDVPIPANSTGRLIGTGFLNLAMPLIRYEIGDRGSISNCACGCGRHLPILSSIEGRMDDVIITMDGRSVGRLDPIFKAELPILEAQIIQEKRNQLRVKYVPAVGFDSSSAEALIALLRLRVGDMSITLEEVQSIPRSVNGKFRAVISNLPK